METTSEPIDIPLYTVTTVLALLLLLLHVTDEDDGYRMRCIHFSTRQLIVYHYTACHQHYSMRNHQSLVQCTWLHGVELWCGIQSVGRGPMYSGHVSMTHSMMLRLQFTSSYIMTCMEDSFKARLTLVSTEWECFIRNTLGQLMLVYSWTLQERARFDCCALLHFEWTVWCVRATDIHTNNHHELIVLIGENENQIIWKKLEVKAAIVIQNNTYGNKPYKHVFAYS